MNMCIFLFSNAFCFKYTWSRYYTQNYRQGLATAAYIRRTGFPRAFYSVSHKVASLAQQIRTRFV